MKTLFLLVSVFSAGVQAEEINLIPRDVQVCTFWTSIKDSMGRYAYACSSYPRTITVPDYLSMERENQALKDKLSDLERRVAALEAKN